MLTINRRLRTIFIFQLYLDVICLYDPSSNNSFIIDVNKKNTIATREF